MAYHTYTTDSLVLGGADVGEGSRMLHLYTKEFGLVSAVARSVREARSKLRYGLQTMSRSDIALVRGKDVWRITGAREQLNYYYLFKSDQAKQDLALRLIGLVRRLVRGEEPHEAFFDLLTESFTFLAEHGLTKELLITLECVIVLRILSMLGYVGILPELEAVLRSGTLSEALLQDAAAHQKRMVKEINASLLAAQL